MSGDWMIETVMVFKHKHTQMLAGNVQVTSLEACKSKLIHNQHIARCPQGLKTW